MSEKKTTRYWAVWVDAHTFGSEGIGPVPYEDEGLTSEECDGFFPGSKGTRRILDKSWHGKLRLISGVRRFDFFVKGNGKYGLLSPRILNDFLGGGTCSFDGLEKISLQFAGDETADAYFGKLKYIDALSNLTNWGECTFVEIDKQRFREYRIELRERGESDFGLLRPTRTGMQFDSVVSFVEFKRNSTAVIFPDHLCLKLKKESFPAVINLSATLTIVRDDLAKKLGSEYSGMAPAVPSVTVSMS